MPVLDHVLSVHFCEQTAIADVREASPATFVKMRRQCVLQDMQGSMVLTESVRVKSKAGGPAVVLDLASSVYL